ncbi:MAG: peptide ligase PGM1-related protein, partial [Bacteroidota bacterium]
MSLSEERKRFLELQAAFRMQYEQVFPDRMAPRCVIIIPSLTLDQEILERVKGHFFYEERMLCLLMLLRMPHTHVTYVTSIPIDPVIIDYYLHLLPGITGYHARKRLTLLSCYDASAISLTDKILSRPRLLQRIRESIPYNYPAHIASFVVPAKERFYFATDNLQRDAYKGLSPHDLIEIAVCNQLHYNSATGEGVVFHLISALSQYGKLGLVCIGRT